MYHAPTPPQHSPDHPPPPSSSTPSSASPPAPNSSYLHGSSYLYNHPVTPYYNYNALGSASSSAAAPSPAIWSPAVDSTNRYTMDSKMMKASPQGSLSSSTSSSIPSSPESFSHYLGHTPAPAGSYTPPGGNYTPLTPLGMMPPSTGSELGGAGSPGGGWGGYGAGTAMQPYRTQGK